VVRKDTRKALRRLIDLARHRRGQTFTVADAERFGISRKTLARLAQDLDATERIARFDRGIYQVLPDQRQDHILAAWRKVGEDAIASHQTALALLNLSDVDPMHYEFTVPRARRSRAHGARFRLHTTTSRPKTVTVDGVPVTSPARTIVDCALLGEQTEMAVAQALARGLTTEHELRAEAHGRPRAVRVSIENAIGRRSLYAGYV
jgi:predicted transcriptional regulator of viral defense system